MELICKETRAHLEHHRIARYRDPMKMQAATKADPMARAFHAARRAGARGEVPVGAVVTDSGGAVLAVRGNAMRANTDACAHAEVLAMRMAARRLPSHASRGRLEGCDLWVTLEPCAMCALAAGMFRVRRIVFAAYDPNGGGIEHGLRVFEARPGIRRPEIVGGIREIESRNMLQDFFRDLRAKSSGNDTTRPFCINMSAVNQAPGRR
jgi:cytosine deaminase